MSNTWLPTWLDVVGTIVFLVIAVAHAGHAVGVHGRSRPWHGVHALMALGMLDMFWAADTMPVPATPGKIVFVLSAVAALGATAWFSRGGRPPSWPWLVAAVDLGAMAAMFELMERRYAAVSVLLTAWFLAEAAGWASGLLSVAAERQALGNAAEDAATPLAAEDGRSAAGAGGRRSTVTVLAVRRHGVYARTVRLSLVVMALGMAYMLLAMQFGTTATPMPAGPMPM